MQPPQGESPQHKDSPLFSYMKRAFCGNDSDTRPGTLPDTGVMNYEGARDEDAQEIEQEGQRMESTILSPFLSHDC